MALSNKFLKRAISMSPVTIGNGKNCDVKPFCQIPGPKTVPILGSSWKYFPFIGDWDMNRLHQAGEKRLKQYGHVVREEISATERFVHVYRPEDIEKVYQLEGKFPERRSHLGLLHYRLTRPHLYNSGGLLPMNGSEWWRLRSAFQKYIARVQDARHFLPVGGDIIKEFVENMLSNNCIVEDFLPLVSRLYMELMWMFMFGKRLYCFDTRNMGEDSVPSQLMRAAETYEITTMATDNTEKLWKIFKTPSYKKMESSLEYIEKIAIAALKELKTEIDTSKMKNIEETFLIEKYFQTPGIDDKDINGMTVDLILGGVDTTAYTTSFIMYNLARNREAQEKLKTEANALLPLPDSVITGDVLNSASYGRAILKESLRLNPVSIGVSRYLQQDSVFSGYSVPKGTVMITQNLVACRNEENFKNALSFIPERWIRGSPEFVNVNPYLILPFSHGPRTCIARRLAEQNMLTLLLTIGRKYSMHWLGDELDIQTPLTCKPDRPVKLSFHAWDSV